MAGKSRSKQFEIGQRAAAREAGKDVIGAEQNRLRSSQLCQQRFEIVAAALDLDVIALRDVVDAHVQFGSAGHAAGGFLAEEEIGPRAQRFGSVDGIVVGDGYQVHAQALQFLVNGQGLVVAFPAHAPQKRDGAHSGVPRVNVQVAPHISLL